MVGQRYKLASFLESGAGIHRAVRPSSDRNIASTGGATKDQLRQAEPM